MKTLFAAAALWLVVPTLAAAQSADHSLRGEGYFFIGPLVSNVRYVYVFNPACYGIFGTPGESLPDCYFEHHEQGGVNTGFGGEVISKMGLGFGAEAGYGGQDWSFSGNGVGVGSLNASYRFLGKKSHTKLQPFVPGGYSLYFGDRTDFQSGFNLGGGVNFWIAKHAALRLEVRDQDHINRFHSQFTRFVAFRIGMTFR